MNIAIYSRKSKFVEGSESIENQIEMCKEYIRRNIKNVDNILIYEDEGFSGGNINRPQFTQLLKDAKDKAFNILVCYRLDRISRNVSDFSSFITELQKLDIDFISIKEQFDTSNPMGRAMLYISSVFAQLERETIAERVRDNMLELSKTGKWLGGKEPLGYKKIGIKKDAYLGIDEKYMNIVKKIYNKYLEVKSLTGVYRWTLENRIKTNNGTNFSVTSLRIILTNPVYIVADLEFYNYAKENKMIICNSEEEFKNNKEYGIMCFNKKNKSKNFIRNKSEWIIAIGKHKGIIQTEKWIEVQETILENVNKYPRSGTSHIALLSGLIKCAKCKGVMTVLSCPRGKKTFYYYYRCRTKSLAPKICNVKNANVKKVDEEVLNAIKVYRCNKNMLRKLYKDNKEDLKGNDVLENIKNINESISKNKSNIESLTEKLIDAENSTASKYIVQKIEKLDKEIQKLNETLLELKSKESAIKSKKQNYELLESTIDYLIDNLDTLSLEDKKRLIRIIVKVAYWDGENIKIKLLI